MKVQYCENCPFKERRTWSQYYQPANYHAIGMSHAYAYCKFAKERCLKVRCMRCKKYQDDREWSLKVNKKG